MFSPLFALLTFSSLTLAASSNSTATDCPSCDATACDKRSIWSLLAGCGVTLFICVWHAVHPGLPLPHWKWYNVLMARIFCMLVTFIAPELTISCAVGEWYAAKKVTKDVYDRGYHWWTSTHSHFVLNGGFVLCDSKGFREIKANELLRLLDAKEIVNPVVTEADIKDRSSSDSLAKAILTAQLSWFMTQIIVRLVNHLAVTLIELDTMCMALLALPLLFCWWKKPFCPARPHIFYKHDASARDDPEMSTKENDSEKLLPAIGEIPTIVTRRDAFNFWDCTNGSQIRNKSLSLVLTWSVFGTLHLVAWNYEFLTAPEKILWRVVSLALAISPIFWAPLEIFLYIYDCDRSEEIAIGGIVLMLIGITFRLLLVAIMLASLRSLPSSAYQIIPWTTYIPHL